MSATFNPSLISLKDHIRLALGDTNTAAALLVDETIDAKIAAFGYAEGLAQCAEALISLYGQRPDEYRESGGIQVKWSERVPAWQKIVDNARAGRIQVPGGVRIGLGVALAQTSEQREKPAHPDRCQRGTMDDFRSD